MKKDETVSDEQIAAFIDGELDSGEENRIFAHTESCPDLDARICQQRKLKELVQHAYRDVPAPYRSGAGGRRRRSLIGAAAAVVLALAMGAAGGYLAGRAADAGPATAAGTTEDAWLLHVASSDRETMKRALDRAQELSTDPDASSARRVEIVANEGGLDLLRSDVTPFADRIRQLADEDVLFYACNRAIDRLRERGIEVELVPEARTHDTALDRVVLRMRQGWNYEKI